MKPYASAFAVISLVIFGWACAPTAQEETPVAEESSAVPSTEDDMAGLNDLVISWDEGINNQDEEAIIALYSDDPVMMAPFQPAASGDDAIRAWLKDAYAQGLTVQNFMSDARVVGDFAIMHGTFTLELTPEGSTEPVEDKGKWMGILERGADGIWRAKRNIWNSDVPLEGMPATELPEGIEVAEPEEPVCVEDFVAGDDAFVSAFTDGDLATLVALHAADAVRMPPGLPPVQGRAGMASFFQYYFDEFGHRELTVSQAGTRVEGDLGVSWGTFEFAYTPTEGGDPLTGQGKYMATGKRQPNGCWVSHWVSWNSDLSPETEGS